jgi:hypothetical protein
MHCSWRNAAHSVSAFGFKARERGQLCSGARGGVACELAFEPGERGGRVAGSVITICCHYGIQYVFFCLRILEGLLRESTLKKSNTHTTPEHMTVMCSVGKATWHGRGGLSIAEST